MNRETVQSRQELRYGRTVDPEIPIRTSPLNRFLPFPRRGGLYPYVQL